MSNFKCLKILVVDDEPVIRLMHKSLLETEGHRVETASSKKEVLEMFDSSYDMVLMDIDLSGTNGIEVSEEIHHNNPTLRKIPIYAITSHNDDKMRQQCLKSGIRQMLTKPLTYAAFQELIKSV